MLFYLIFAAICYHIYIRAVKGFIILIFVGNKNVKIGVLIPVTGQFFVLIRQFDFSDAVRS